MVNKKQNFVKYMLNRQWHVPQKTANSNENISNGWLGAEQKGNVKMLQFNSSGVQDPLLTEQKAWKPCSYKIMFL